MTREILFRGKRIDNGEWVEGSLALPNYPLSNDAGIFCEGCAWICSKLYELQVCDYDKNEISIGGFIPVDPSTVGQYTGLYDKNGKRIFEGDILSVIGQGIFKCRWDDGNFEFCLSNRKESFGLAYVSLNDIFVIGNIVDNPELLEE